MGMAPGRMGMGMDDGMPAPGRGIVGGAPPDNIPRMLLMDGLPGVAGDCGGALGLGMGGWFGVLNAMAVLLSRAPACRSCPGAWWPCAAPAVPAPGAEAWERSLAAYAASGVIP